MGAVLTYRIDYPKQVAAVGQQVGADMSGGYSTVFYGQSDVCAVRAREVLASLESTFKLSAVMLIIQDEDYYRNPRITEIMVSDHE